MLPRAERSGPGLCWLVLGILGALPPASVANQAISAKTTTTTINLPNITTKTETAGWTSIASTSVTTEMAKSLTSGSVITITQEGGTSLPATPSTGPSATPTSGKGDIVSATSQTPSPSTSPEPRNSSILTYSSGSPDGVTTLSPNSTLISGGTTTHKATTGVTLEPVSNGTEPQPPPGALTSSTFSPTTSVRSSGPGPVGHINCVKIKQVKESQGICLELNETYSCEDFKKAIGVNLTKIICEMKSGKPSGEARDCHLTVVHSEVKPQCMFLVPASSDQLSNILQVMKNHTSDLEKIGIRSFKEESLHHHQNQSRKTLIAVVISGLLLAILGTAGYFLMNRKSWSPAGERLNEDPYVTESGNQGYSPGGGASPEPQDKPSLNRGVRENGTGQASSSNGHSTRPHVADTPL
ncbi:hematopoietic progenitor cell antigen CD34 isoform X2 [Tachyglossus aculeatus]|uniref:hematopoietic progenitor cell antigen CD34 isoform X2 n=1 Tax=Tachyglossus aculeatus TaxID=9261 RepID=UPI0018F6014B|nr:hematopoietic progenitor cell antigen CD34 isoform X2 [Tachyglossus aculeatus]